MKSEKRVLFVAPHADDELLGCGGVIAKYSQRGDHLAALILTDASKGAPSQYSESYISQLRSDTLEAHAFIGLQETIFMDFPAPKLDQTPVSEIADGISRVISEFVPSIVFIPHVGDAHVDHQVAHDASLVACRPKPNSVVERVIVYETLSETGWGRFDRPFVPNYFEELEEQHLTSKIKAMEMIESQIQSYPHPRSRDAIRSLAAYRGASVGVRMAEAFAVVRTVLRNP